MLNNYKTIIAISKDDVDYKCVKTRVYFILFACQISRVFIKTIRVQNTHLDCSKIEKRRANADACRCQDAPRNVVDL